MAADALIRVVVQGDEAEAGISRISGALGRLERAEPTLALRSTRRAIDELAVAATGLHPALGRVVATMAEFGIGGVTGLAAVAGLAAIGLEVKALLNLSKDLDASLLKLNAQFAQMGGAGAIGMARLAGIEQQRESLREPGFFRQMLFNMIGDPTGGALSVVGTQRILSSEATLANEAARQAAQLQDTRRQQLLAEANALETSNIALAKARLGTQANTQATVDALDRLAHRADVVRLSTLHLTDADRDLILAQDDMARRIAGDLERRERALDSALARGDLGVLGAPFDKGVAGGPAKIGDIGKSFGPAFEKFAPRVFFLQDLVKDGGKIPPEKPDAARLAAESVALLGAMRQGGAAGIFGSLGGIASDLGGLAGHPELKFLGPLGIGLSAFSGLLGVFDHSEERRHKELIDAINRQGKEVGLQRQRVFIVDGRTGAIAELRQAEDHDAVTRVAGYAGETG